VLRAVLFAFHGVLVDDEPIHLELFRRVLGEEGIAVPDAGLSGPQRGLDDRGRFAAALAAAGETATVPRLMRLLTRKSSYYQDRVRREGYPFSPGAAGLARDLAARRWMLGVVTGAQREEVEAALRQEGLLDSFKVLITSEDVREGKPSPEGYERALEAFNSLPPLPERLLHPHEVLAVEASPEGLAAAAEVGLPTLGVARSGSRGRLPGADVVVETLSGLTPERLGRLYAEASRR
jgi:phosphoglycolate phosphatase/beta-phosphoglucomutase